MIGDCSYYQYVCCIPLVARLWAGLRSLNRRGIMEAIAIQVDLEAFLSTEALLD